MIAIDCETNGVDYYHGVKPFFITTCNENGEQRFWEVGVDPLTREPQWPKEDIIEIGDYITEHDKWVFQNCRFDIKGLKSVGVELPEDFWGRIDDDLMAGHLLASNQPHDLTSMAVQYLGVDISPYEERLNQATDAARRLCRSQYPEWKIAKQGLEGMPSAKEKCWKYDTWLPRALARELGEPSDHPWYTVLRDYSNKDSEVTLALWLVMEQDIKRRGLWEIYLERLKVLPVAYQMESNGVTISGQRLQELETRFKEDSAKAANVCVNIAHSYGYALELPKSGRNKSLVDFCFGPNPVTGKGGNPSGLCLPWVNRSKKTAEPSLDKASLDHWEATLPDNSKQLAFIKALKEKRARDTACTYMDSYRRFWLPLKGKAPTIYGPTVSDPSKGWYILHPSINPTGTATLRWSSSNPNSQNISKRESFSLRYCFGPAPGREWWSLDYENIELRIPAYESGEQAMIDLFEHPDDPPYFGSNHLLFAHILHPQRFEECKNDKGEIDGRIFKERYASTWYQWTKNGDFALVFGAVEESGTADRAYHVPGAHRKIKERLRAFDNLNQKYIRFAEKHGYVETLPDKTVNPHKGYPLLCTRTERGQILPTVPLNYHVQSTAMWCTAKAMVRCQGHLSKLNKHLGQESYLMVLQVHDEIVFDTPKGGKENLPIINHLRELMEKSGDDIGIPLKVSVSYHPETWAKKEKV